MLDSRGYGRSQDKPSEKGLMIDIRAARDWFAAKEGIEPEQIVLYGRSLGGGVAVDLASKDGAKGLILESTFTPLPNVANDLLPLWPGMLMLNRYNSLKRSAIPKGPYYLPTVSRMNLSLTNMAKSFSQQLTNLSASSQSTVPVTTGCRLKVI